MEFKRLRDEAGLTLAELAELSGYSTGTINGLELHGEGSERLKATLRSILKERLRIKDSVESGRPESVTPGVDQLVARPDNITLEQWRRRAMVAEEKLKGLQTNLRAALAYSEAPVPPVSSKPASAAARYGAKGAASTGSDPAK